MTKKSGLLIFFVLLSCFIAFYFVQTQKSADTQSATVPALHNNSGRTVLVIYSYHNSLPWQAKIRASLFANLEKIPFGQRTEVYEEKLDALRFDNLTNQDQFFKFLQAKYQNVKLDLVITESDLAYQFLKKHSDFLPHIPRLHILTDSLDEPDNSDNVLKALPNAKKAVLTVTEVLPKLRKLVVIGLSNTNTASVKAQDIDEIKRLIPQLEKRGIQLDILPLLSFAELYQTVAQLNSPDTALLYFPVGVDRLGEREIPKRVLKELSQIAHVPIFVHHDSLLDVGSVGGYLLSADKIGKLMADTVLGKPLPKNSAEIEGLTTGYYFNDKELKRWHIPDSNLPPDSIILNRLISEWYKYRWEIAEATIALLFELGLIILLLNNLRLRKQATLALKQERDLLEQRVIERTADLKANEDFISSVLDSLTAHIAVLNDEGIIIAVNNAWREFAKDNGMPECCQDNLGTSYLDVSQKSYHDEHIEEVDTVQQGIRAVMAGRRDAFYFEYPCHSSTEQRWFYMRVSPFSGVQQGVVISHENITQRKLIEVELQIAATIFESQTVGMMITDASTDIIKVNQAFTNLTGYSEAEVLHQKPRLLHSGRQDRLFYDTLWQNIRDSGGWQGEIWNKRKNGDIYPEIMTITAVRANQGEITHYVATHTDITERKAAEEEIKQLAFFDPLTGLPNRRKLLDRLQYAIALNHRANSQFAVFMMDLDKFKAVNDKLGHAAGDELLKQVAARITSCLRESDMVARLGGDEFVFVLENLKTPEDAEIIALKVIADLTLPFLLSENNSVQIGASIGISLYPQHGSTPEILMDHADSALCQAKDNGRGCFAYFSGNG
ncbi:MAG: sensor domain-containing diguanylate cyclase [Methylococcales bacterium]